MQKQEYLNSMLVAVRHVAVILGVIVLTGLMTSCAASPKTVIEYVYETPDIPSFPVFPDPHPVIYNEETDTVSMPLWYWQKIAEYKIDIDAIEIYIDRVKKLDN